MPAPAQPQAGQSNGDTSSQVCPPAPRMGTEQKNAVIEYADFETERSVLACILTDPDCIDTVLSVFGGLNPPDEITDPKKSKKKKTQIPFNERKASMIFRDPKYAIVFQAVLELAKESKKPDIVTVYDYLQKEGKAAMIGDLPFLMDLANSVRNVANIEGWCNILLDWAMLRETIRSCSNALELAKLPGRDVKQLLDDIESSLFSVRNNFLKEENTSIQTLMEQTFDYFLKLVNKEIEPGIPTGFADLDNILGGGLKKQEMVVLAARPSIGKTAFALNIARNIVMKRVEGHPQKSVAFFSLEMSANQVAQRLLCTESGIPLTAFLDGSFHADELPRLTGAVQNWKETKLFVDATGGLNIFELRAKARKLKDKENIDLIIIDYLQLMHAGEASESRQVEVAAISGGIKKIAKDLDIPILVLSQLNREVEGTPTGKPVKPKLNNIRESGSIEQDADVVIFLHRDRDESKEGRQEAPPGESGHAGVRTLVIVEKNRNGKTGEVSVNFLPALMEFRSMRYDRSNMPKAHESTK